MRVRGSIVGLTQEISPRTSWPPSSVRNSTRLAARFTYRASSCRTASVSHIRRGSATVNSTVLGGRRLRRSRSRTPRPSPSIRRSHGIQVGRARLRRAARRAVSAGMPRNRRSSAICLGARVARISSGTSSPRFTSACRAEINTHVGSSARRAPGLGHHGAGNADAGRLDALAASRSAQPPV